MMDDDKIRAAVKVLQDEAQAEFDAFAASDEGLRWFGDCFAGLGVTRITVDGKIERVDPKDLCPPDAALKCP